MTKVLTLSERKQKAPEELKVRDRRCSSYTGCEGLYKRMWKVVK